MERSGSGICYEMEISVRLFFQCSGPTLVNTAEINTEKVCSLKVFHFYLSIQFYYIIIKILIMYNILFLLETFVTFNHLISFAKYCLSLMP